MTTAADEATEVGIREREGCQPELLTEGCVYCYIPDLYIASVEEASPWARRDKMDWSSEVRSSRVPRVGGALEWDSGLPYLWYQKRKNVNIVTRQRRQQCFNCQEHVRQRSET